MMTSQKIVDNCNMFYVECSVKVAVSVFEMVYD